jgi:excinuclease ABC subunit B
LRGRLRPPAVAVARLRDEIKRLQAVELAVGDDPLARQAAVEAAGGAYEGERKYGRAANMPSRVHKPTDEDMGPHNLGGGEARPKGGGGWKPKRKGR